MPEDEHGAGEDRGEDASSPIGLRGIGWVATIALVCQ